MKFLTIVGFVCVMALSQCTKAPETNVPCLTHQSPNPDNSANLTPGQCDQSPKKDCSYKQEAPKQPSFADSLSDILQKVADPNNKHFDDFTSSLGKVIDTLNPTTDSAKIPKRVDSLIGSVGDGLKSYDEHHASCL
jgi:hypothetical protein